MTHPPMNPDKQRITIAEACGWKWNPANPPTDARPYYTHPTMRAEYNLPDYLNDLNAMHEAEKVLTLEQFDRYRTDLWSAVCNSEYAFESCAPLIAIRAFISATAAQRAEAFLRTIGKRGDDK